MGKLLRYALATVAVLAALIYGAFQVSPWPSVLLIRQTFGAGAAAASRALDRHVPQGITAIMGEHYDAADADGFLDVYHPASAGGALPTIVWIHGGAFVSGSRADVANYLKILAGQGYTTVAVGYSLAPGATYPKPLQQLNAALGHLQQHAERLRVDPSRLFLAGDSAGAQIAGQMSNVITSAEYAQAVGVVPSITRQHLRGAILFCGPHGTDSINFDGPFGGFLSTVLWAYFGTSDFRNDPRLQQFSVAANMTKDYPPFFVSVGNADPLAPLSYALKAKADELGVPADALFFAADYHPPLAHEYQFDLDGEAGQQALARMLAFLKYRS